MAQSASYASFFFMTTVYIKVSGLYKETWFGKLPFYFLLIEKDVFRNSRIHFAYGGQEKNIYVINCELDLHV